MHQFTKVFTRESFSYTVTTCTYICTCTCTCSLCCDIISLLLVVKVILEVFSQLEALARVKSDHLLMEISVVGSWVTEAGLNLQALVKRSRQSSGVGDRIAASKEVRTFLW